MLHEALRSPGRTDVASSVGGARDLGPVAFIV